MPSGGSHGKWGLKMSTEAARTEVRRGRKAVEAALTATERRGESEREG